MSSKYFYLGPLISNSLFLTFISFAKKIEYFSKRKLPLNPHLNSVMKLIPAVCIFILMLSVSCKKSGDQPITPPPLTASPTISSFTPASDTTGGTIVITGTNFSTNTTEDIVQINGVTATVVSATATELTIKVPIGASSGNIKVTVNGQSVTSSSAFVLTETGPSPVITKFSPTISGIGYPITIQGTGFNTDIASNIVTINGGQATVVSASDTQLVVTVPITASTGKISVTVKGRAGTSTSDIRIIKLTVTTIAGSGLSGFADGTGIAASFNTPWGIVGDQNGNHYVADSHNGAVRKVTSAGVVTTFAGPDAFSGNGTGLFGIAMDSHGNFYVSEQNGNQIKKITPGGTTTTFAGDMNGNGGNINGTGTTARFNSPMGLAVDANDNVFVSESGNLLIRKITPAGVVTTFAGTGIIGHADGTGTAASFQYPFNMCMGADGNLYVADVNNFIFRKITPAAVVSTYAGSGIKGIVDGPALSAQFAWASSMCMDHAGNLYVAEGQANYIRMITTDGIVVTLAGNSKFAAVDGVGGFASFYYPSGMTVDADGTIYITELGSNTVRKLVIQ